MAFVRPFPITASGVVGPAGVVSAEQGSPAYDAIVTLVGWSLIESAGTNAVTLTLTDHTGAMVGVATALGGASSPPAWFGPEGVKCRGQLTATFSGTGSPKAVIYIR